MVKFKTEIEECLWIEVYKSQLNKASYPIGESTAKAQSVQCSDFADNAVLEFRARSSNYQKYTVTNLTPNTQFYGTHGDSLTDVN